MQLDEVMKPPLPPPFFDEAEQVPPLPPEDFQLASPDLQQLSQPSAAACLAVEGWGHKDVPQMMREVMNRVADVVKLEDPKALCWTEATKAFVSMMKITLKTLQPDKQQRIQIQNGVVLDNLRQLKLGESNGTIS